MTKNSMTAEEYEELTSKILDNFEEFIQMRDGVIPAPDFNEAHDGREAAKQSLRQLFLEVVDHIDDKVGTPEVYNGANDSENATIAYGNGIRKEIRESLGKVRSIINGGKNEYTR